MEIKTKRNNPFSAISINRITAERFRTYSKTVSRSHSGAIDAMIDFFEKAKISPKSEVMVSFIRFQNYMMRRFDYLEELLREMECNTKATHDMLKSLFEGTAPKKREHPLLVGKKDLRMTREEWDKQGPGDLVARAGQYCKDLLEKATPTNLPEQVTREMDSTAARADEQLG